MLARDPGQQSDGQEVIGDKYLARPWTALYGNLPDTIEPPFTDLASLFRNAVKRGGDRQAIAYFDRQISYTELDHLTDAFAAGALQLGVQSGDRVAIVLQNVPQFAVAAIGAWKIGAVPVPCNPMYTPRELSFILSDSSPRLVICHTEIEAVVNEAIATSGIPSPAVRTVGAATWQTRNDYRVLPDVVDGNFDDLLTSKKSGNLKICIPKEHPAILMYTSGTTGTPKGAVLSHQAVAFNAESARVWFALPDECLILAMAPLFHITGLVVNLIAAHSVVGSLVMTYRFHPLVTRDAIIEYRPSFIIGAITAFSALANLADADPEQFASLRQIYSGGAPISPALAANFRARTGKTLLPAYGMTETSAPTHVTPPGLEPPIDKASGALSIGIPTSNVDAIVVDDDGIALPIGEAGELLLKGPQIMSGYWNRPEETGKALADGWMHTGDVAVMDAQGWFYLVDRKKDVIIASGFKVWPREVEDVLYEHPSIREAAVVGIPDSYRGETVKAVVSCHPDSRVDPVEIVRWCKTKLAGYKIPKHVEILEDLPKTASGKIMRAALRVL